MRNLGDVLFLTRAMIWTALLGALFLAEQARAAEGPEGAPPRDEVNLYRDTEQRNMKFVGIIE